MITGITFCGREQAEDMLPDPTVAVISITDPGSSLAAIRDGFMSVHRVQFWDYDPERVENVWMRTEMIRSGKVMTREQAAGVAGYVREIEAQGAAGLVVHCEAGISRSAAVALWTADERDIFLPKNETFHHNRWVYKMLLRASGDLEGERHE